MSHGTGDVDEIKIVDPTDPARKLAVDAEGRIAVVNAELVAAVKENTAALIDLRAFLGRLNPNVF